MRINSINVNTKYKVADIVMVLKKNKESHLNEYKEAMYAYQIDLTERIKKHLAQLEKYNPLPGGVKIPPYVSNNFGLALPVNEAKSYDKMIRIFQLGTEDTVELSMDDANKIFNDEWDWLIGAKAINSSYSNSDDSCGD